MDPRTIFGGNPLGVIIRLLGCLQFDGPNNGSGRIITDLRVHGPKDGVGVHDNRVGGKGEEGSAAHGIMGDENRDLALVGLNRVGDL